MRATTILSRRTFLSTAASIAAMGTSFMMLPKGYAGPVGRGDDRLQEHGSPVQGAHHGDDEMKKCIQLCQDCHALCTQTVAHCLRLGGRHATPDHIGLLLDCSQICEITAQYLLRGSSLHERICGLCAEACKQCAESCVRTAGDDQIVKQCVEMCGRCADSCERMTSKVAA